MTYWTGVQFSSTPPNSKLLPVFTGFFNDLLFLISYKIPHFFIFYLSNIWTKQNKFVILLASKEITPCFLCH